MKKTKTITEKEIQDKYNSLKEIIFNKDNHSNEDEYNRLLGEYDYYSDLLHAIKLENRDL